ncbi:MAG: YjjG family noncanonical pyrimidine nucleotidase [Bacteroidales bacterium]|nr:YjjG family noncanonical pyrimidine nucleotidase [Bacteroidales bacterium]MCF8405268.1 YjjG family noncanonical pyrimidine nucleotidase [Bacteroidales bacterium]
MKYRHIFIDLDRTLYDFDKSTRITFLELYDKFSLKQNGANDFDEFFELYKKNNVELWAQYREGKIKKKFLNVERFHVTLLHFGIDDRAFAGRFASEYLQKSPQNKALFPGAIEALEYLFNKYTLHIITNGFDEVQRVKMKSNDLNKYFKTITTSEEAGAKKPNEKIFHFAFALAQARAMESLMIGDDYEVDILGAKNVGMDQMWFLNDGDQTMEGSTYIINKLSEIPSLI